MRVPMVPEATNRSKGATPKTNQPSAMTTYTARAMAAVERTGTPFVGETAPSGAGPTSSRESAYSSLVAPTTHASAQPKALTAAPMVMSSPTQPATNWLPRSPSSEPDAIKFSTPLASVPKPITSTAVTKTKYRPPKIATPKIARGMSRRGSRASSPSVAAASNPAKDRKPKTTPRNTADSSVPGATVKTSPVKPTSGDGASAGTLPDSSRTSTIALITRISATVTPSTVSSTDVPRRAGTIVSASA